MPYSIALSASWDNDFTTLASIEGAGDLIDWFGYLPSFHDCTISKLEFQSGNGVLELACFRMTDKVDDRGYFVLDRHALVSFHFTNVRGLLFDCNANTTILELGVRRLSLEHLPVSNTSASVNDFEISFDDVCGGSGSIYASEVRLSLKPA
jgi:hypothetical protein